MNFKVTIHYIVPCKHGGIQSQRFVHYLNAPDEDEAERLAKIVGVNDPAYLYTSLIEAERIFIH